MTPTETTQIAPGLVVLGDSFEKHRIRGTVYHAIDKGLDPELDAPLISHVEGNLWQGGCLHGIQLPDGFRNVVSLYPWEKYRLPEGCYCVEVTMYDSLEQGLEQIDNLADKVVKMLDDGPTLVHCQAGLNRSGLLAAVTLVKLGHTPDEAIKLLRRRSPLVLCNDTFEEHVRSLA